MPQVSCVYWQEYNSINGPVCYCEVAAFDKKLSAQELAKIGCTPEKRRQCLSLMEAQVGRGTVAATPPAVVTNACNAPKEVASSHVAIAENKARSSWLTLVILGILAGAYIAFGAEFSTMVTHDLAGKVGDGLTRLITGMAFSVGLVMVVIGGAELFTGNNLMAIGVLQGRVSVGQLLRNWAIVYLANFAGSLAVVGIMYATGLWAVNGGLVGAKAVAIANTKATLSLEQAFFRGIMCNWLVCLAVWLATAGRDVISKIVGIMLPITAFVASGFEHSIANMYFIPMGLALKGEPIVLAALAKAGNISVAQAQASLAGLTWSNFLLGNLLWVTIGNIVGGAIFVGTAYWSVYLRPTAKAVRAQRAEQAQEGITVGQGTAAPAAK
ncbi:MAG: formate/nitrite transporter family protein [Clostridia bacterium]|nr:formate/nitrite transporter family protein [Clostridia bacterium]